MSPRHMNRWSAYLFNQLVKKKKIEFKISLYYSMYYDLDDYNLLSICTVITFDTYEPIFLAWIQTHVTCY